METESFEKLTRLKKIVGQMSISDKLAFVAQIKSRLAPEMLKFSDGTHVFSEENLLSVGLGALVAEGRNEFEHMAGFYANGYKSEIRRGMYHGKGEIPNPKWSREIRRLYHLIKEHAADVQLPEVKELPEDFVPANAWQLSRY